MNIYIYIYIHICVFRPVYTYTNDTCPKRNPAFHGEEALECCIFIGVEWAANMAVSLNKGIPM